AREVTEPPASSIVVSDPLSSTTATSEPDVGPEGPVEEGGGATEAVPGPVDDVDRTAGGREAARCEPSGLVRNVAVTTAATRTTRPARGSRTRRGGRREAAGPGSVDPPGSHGGCPRAPALRPRRSEAQPSPTRYGTVGSAD